MHVANPSALPAPLLVAAPLALDARFQAPVCSATAELQALVDSGWDVTDRVAAVHGILHKHGLPL